MEHIIFGIKWFPNLLFFYFARQRQVRVRSLSHQPQSNLDSIIDHWFNMFWLKTMVLRRVLSFSHNILILDRFLHCLNVLSPTLLDIQNLGQLAMIAKPADQCDILYCQDCSGARLCTRRLWRYEPTATIISALRWGNAQMELIVNLV